MTVRNLSLVETVYSDLRERLRFSEIAPDERLVDTDIAASYGTSRMPAREALLRLVAEGYLVGTTRGFAVSQLDARDIAELFELRRQLEPRAAAAAARDLTAEGARAISAEMAIIRAAHANGDLKVMVRANVAFRDAWIACISNRRLAGTIARFIDYFQAIRFATFSDRATRRLYVESLDAFHQALLDRDPLAAGDRMSAFLFVAEAAYVAALAAQEHDDLESPPSEIRKARTVKKREP